MEYFNNLIIPLTISFILLYGLLKGVNIFDVFISGAKEGISTAFSILPSLIALMTAVGMIIASGGLDVISNALEPLAKLLFIPKEGISTAFSILPSLIALMTAVGMIIASGGLDVISNALEPLAKLLFIPKELVPLGLLRPISGSGALAIYENILSVHGPDSFIGKVASVMQGSTETTFYTIAVYYGAVKVIKTKYTLVPALTADIVGFIMSGLIVSTFFK